MSNALPMTDFEANRINVATGDRVKLAREAAGLSQAQLAERVGLSDGMVSHLETGRRAWSASYLYAFARALNIDARRLLPPDHTGSSRLEAGPAGA